jgi:ATP phosphoribosyltransferase regulatory subunit
MADVPQTPSSGLLPAGLSDLMPRESTQEAAAIASIMGSFTSLGYARVKPPLVEFEDTLLADGPGAALIRDTFRLIDPQSSRMMAIRADMTAQIARIARTRMAHESRPLRLAYAGDVLRVHPDPLNPERQLTQVGAEMIGANQNLHDAELAIAALVALDRVGVEHLTIDFGAPRLLAMLIPDGAPSKDDLIQAVAAKDRKLVRAYADDFGGDLADLLCQLLDLPMVASQQREGHVEMLMKALPEPAAAMLDDVLTIATLTAATIPEVSVTVDPLECRGFDYHHGVGFAIFAPGVRGELGRGGRYRTVMADGRADSGRADSEGEESTGVTIYLERVLRILPPLPEVKIIYIPHDAAVDDAGLKMWIEQSSHHGQCRFGQSGLTGEAALHDDAVVMGATHIFKDGGVHPLSD